MNIDDDIPDRDTNRPVKGTPEYNRRCLRLFTVLFLVGAASTVTNWFATVVNTQGIIRVVSIVLCCVSLLGTALALGAGIPSLVYVLRDRKRLRQITGRK